MELNRKELETKFRKINGKIGGCASRIKLAARAGDAVEVMIQSQKRILLEDEAGKIRHQLQQLDFAQRI